MSTQMRTAGVLELCGLIDAVTGTLALQVALPFAASLTTLPSAWPVLPVVPRRHRRRS